MVNIAFTVMLKFRIGSKEDGFRTIPVVHEDARFGVPESYWVSWSKNVITMGQGNTIGSYSIANYTTKRHLNIRHIGITTVHAVATLWFKGSLGVNHH